ncbi:unnamed protein product [Diplocarpon coronariae]
MRTRFTHSTQSFSGCKMLTDLPKSTGLPGASSQNRIFIAKMQFVQGRSTSALGKIDRYADISPHFTSSNKKLD